MRNSFYGWYLKCQSDTQTIAVIPAVHQAGRKRTCSIQVITEEGSWTVAYPGKAFKQKGKRISIGQNSFDENGIYLAVNTQKLHMKGRLRFGPLSPLKYSIMGPFSMLAFMECSHSIFSMRHAVSGTLFVNGEKYVFQDALGYWEGDEGRSFPKSYIWTQCFLPEGSVMLSVADIPVGRWSFTGIIAVVLWKGKEYRLATYLGARSIQIDEGLVRIRQGKMELEARLLEPADQKLRAPHQGKMARTIHESAACKAFYRFRKDGRTIFALESDRASFEYEK